MRSGRPVTAPNCAATDGILSTVTVSTCTRCTAHRATARTAGCDGPVGPMTGEVWRGFTIQLSPPFRARLCSSKNSTGLWPAGVLVSDSLRSPGQTLARPPVIHLAMDGLLATLQPLEAVPRRCSSAPAPPGLPLGRVRPGTLGTARRGTISPVAGNVFRFSTLPLRKAHLRRDTPTSCPSSPKCGQYSRTPAPVPHGWGNRT